MSFKVGDKVIINSNGSMYNYTKPGSWGYVTYIYDKDQVKVLFEELTGASSYEANIREYNIWVDYLDLLEESKLVSMKHAKVIAKIKQLDNKFQQHLLNKNSEIPYVIAA
jgi:hypothetical protein